MATCLHGSAGLHGQLGRPNVRQLYKHQGETPCTKSHQWLSPIENLYRSPGAEHSRSRHPPCVCTTGKLARDLQPSIIRARRQPSAHRTVKSSQFSAQNTAWDNPIWIECLLLDCSAILVAQMIAMRSPQASLPSNEPTHSGGVRIASLALVWPSNAGFWHHLKPHSAPSNTLHPAHCSAG